MAKIAVSSPRWYGFLQSCVSVRTQRNRLFIKTESGHEIENVAYRLQRTSASLGSLSCVSTPPQLVSWKAQASLSSQRFWFLKRHCVQRLHSCNCCIIKAVFEENWLHQPPFGVRMLILSTVTKDDRQLGNFHTHENQSMRISAIRL